MPIQIHALARAALLAICCGLSAQAGAQTVVLDSYGPDIEFLEGWPTPLFEGQNVAIPFELAFGTNIQSILTTVDGVGSVILGILARQAAVPTDLNWLHSTLLVDPLVNSLLSPAGWNLDAGSYWLVAMPSAGFEGSWQSPTNNASANWAYSSAPGVWTEVTSSFTGMPGARITVTSVVPEPASVALMLAGGLLVAGVARRKSQE
jgi:hypothetical protein